VNSSSASLEHCIFYVLTAPEAQNTRNHNYLLKGGQKMKKAMKYILVVLVIVTMLSTMAAPDTAP
jgi:hypothetical protein